MEPVILNVVCSTVLAWTEQAINQIDGLLVTSWRHGLSAVTKTQTWFVTNSWNICAKPAGLLASHYIASGSDPLVELVRALAHDSECAIIPGSNRNVTHKMMDSMSRFQRIRIWFVACSVVCTCEVGLRIISYHNHYSDVIMGEMTSQITSLATVYSIVYSDADQRKHQSSASLAFVQGIHRWPVTFPLKGPVTRKMFPFDCLIIT